MFFPYKDNSVMVVKSLTVTVSKWYYENYIYLVFLLAFEIFHSRIAAWVLIRWVRLNIKQTKQNKQKNWEVCSAVFWQICKFLNAPGFWVKY